MSSRTFFAALLMLSVTAGCQRGSNSSSDVTYYKEYSEQVEKTNEYIRKYNQLLSQNQKSDKLLTKTGRLMDELDMIALRHRMAAENVASELTTVKADVLRFAVESLSLITKEALNKIDEIETQLSSTNRDHLKEDASSLYLEWSVDVAKAGFDLDAVTQQNLSGLREIFLLIQKDCEKDANARLAALKAPSIKAFAAAPSTFSNAPRAGTGSVSGVVYAPNAVDPVAKALVFAPSKGNEDLQAPVYQPNPNAALPCGEPSEPYLARTCTEPTGKFVLNGLPAGQVRINVKKGAFEKRSTVGVIANKEVALPKVESTLPSEDSETGTYAKIAVIGGAYDRLENVLAKLGLAKLDAQGLPVAGTSKYDFYAAEKGMTLLSSATRMAKYDMIMINCGFGQEEQLRDASLRNNIRNYVNAGGRLYVTDLSYDFVEQVFPQMIAFSGDSDDTTAGEIGAAERGNAGITVNAKIDSLSLLQWLKTVKCGKMNSVNEQRSCLNDDNTSVRVEGFMSGWAMMEKVSSSAAQVWLKGSAGGINERPLTVTFPSGKGRVLYSSYHTFHGGQVGYLYPQERILQYFVFELVQ